MRKIILGLIFILFSGHLPAAQAAEVTIEGFVSITYEDPIKLKKTGCQELNFSYITEDALSRENTVFVVQLIHKSKKIFYGGTAWFSKFTSNGPEALPAMPRIGNLKIKVCRTPWSLGSGANAMKVSAMKPGKYRIYFAGGYRDPETGEKTGEKVETYKTLKVI
jgi:hypothetical protein